MLLCCSFRVALAEAPGFPEICAFVWGAVAPGAAFAVVIEYPAAVRVGAHFQAARIMLGQQLHEGGYNLRLHPLPVPLEWKEGYVVALLILYDGALNRHIEQNRAQLLQIILVNLAVGQRRNNVLEPSTQCDQRGYHGRVRRSFNL